MSGAEVVEQLRGRYATRLSTIVASDAEAVSAAITAALATSAGDAIGVDARVVCRIEHENADQLGAAIVAALGTTNEGGHSPIDQVVAAIVSKSPVDICVILEGSDIIPPHSSGGRLVAELTRRLPGHGHLVLVETGAVVPALTEDWNALGRAAIQLLSRSLTAFPLDTAIRCLNGVHSSHGLPSIDLLATAVRWFDDDRSEAVDESLTSIIATSAASGDSDLEAASVALAAVNAIERQDRERLTALAPRAAQLARAVGSPVLQFVVATANAFAASDRREPDAVLAALAHAPFGVVPPRVARIVQRLRIESMWLSGHAADAVPVVEEVFGRADDEEARRMVALAHWSAGDPTGIDPATVAWIHREQADILTDPRRWPARGYVTSPETRRALDAGPLGPTHMVARACARALTSARAGEPVENPPTPLDLVSQLPLTWVCELAARWHARGIRQGFELASTVVDVVGQPARDELRALTRRNDGDLADGATWLLRQLPTEPTTTLQITVLGPLDVRRPGHEPGDSGEWRIAARELLLLLVAERTVSRERALRIVWPGMPLQAATGELRLALVNLRKILEPERPKADAGFHLRTDGSTITLHPSPHLSVDLWRFDDLHDELERTGLEPRRERQLLLQATSLWRGAPHPGLGGLERLRARHKRALLRLGDLSIAGGEWAAAAQRATEAFALDPHDQHAHQLAIAALTRVGDSESLGAALHRLDASLAESGQVASAATEMVRRMAVSSGRVSG